MNGSVKEKGSDTIPPITITTAAGENNINKEKEQQQQNYNSNELNSEDDADIDLEKFKSSKQGSRKASFFIGDDEQIPVKIVGPDNKEITPDDIVVAPDGGYGYVIVFSAFMTNFVIDGTIFSFGIILDEIIKSGADIKIKTDAAAWIGSLLTGFYLMSGPLVSSLCNKIGFRWTGMIGSVIATIGFILAWYFCRDGIPNMPALFLCYGVLGGIGFGLAYVPSIICVGFYFSKKRALATGIAICGSGIGTFCYAPLIAYLISKFGWEGSLLIQAALIFTCVAFAALYRPLQSASEEEAEKEEPRTPFQTPVGTPLLMRIKRARELEKWDSVNSFTSMDGNNAGFTDGQRKLTYPLIGNGTSTSMEENKTKSEFYENNKNKISSNSLPSAALKPKRLSVPTLLGENLQQSFTSTTSPQRSSSVKNKSFVGIPINLKEIAEETETNADENATDKKVPSDSSAEAQQQNSSITRRSIYLRRSSTTGVGSIANLGSRKGSSNAGMAIVLSSSSLQPLELAQSRILRVATSKTTLNKPLLRDDIFYSGSLSRIPEYANNVDAVFSSVEWKTPMPKIPSTTFISLPEPKKQSKFLVLRRMLDFSLMKSPTFLILAISGAVTMLGFFVPFIYCKSIAEPIIADPTEATFLISIIGISNTAARIFCGALADRPWVNPLMINNGALALGGLATILVPFLNSHALFIIYACVFGISVACFASLRSILIVELLGLSKLTNAFGLLLLFQGAAALVGSPLAGFLKEMTGTYEVTFYVAGAMMLVSGVMCFPLHYVNNWEKKKVESKELLKDLL